MYESLTITNLPDRVPCVECGLDVQYAITRNGMGPVPLHRECWDRMKQPEPAKIREGDQPLPVGNGQSVTDVVVAKFREREKLGISRYGSTLKTFNGRDALKDALEEKYDELQYMTQLLLERDASVEESAERLTAAFIAQHEKAWDMPPPRTATDAYKMGVQDAARIYFLAAKKIREEVHEPVYATYGDFTCTSANSKDCETRAKWLIWYRGPRAMYTYACDFHLMEQMSDGVVDDVKPIGPSRREIQDGE